MLNTIGLFLLLLVDVIKHTFLYALALVTLITAVSAGVVQVYGRKLSYGAKLGALISCMLAGIGFVYAVLLILNALAHTG